MEPITLPFPSNIRFWVLRCFLALLPCIYVAQAQVPTNAQLNTGTNGNGGVLPAGSSDLNWQVTTGTISGTYVPATVMTPYSTYYTSPWPDAEWISLNSTGNHGSRIELFFKNTFNLAPCGSGTASFCLALDFFADNSVYEIYVNGVPQSGPSTFQPPPGPYTHGGFYAGGNVSVNLCNDWIVGANELIVHVKSDPGYVGFLAQTSVSITPPPPPDLSIAAPDVLTCAAPMVTLTASSATPAVVYHWETGSTTNTTTVSAPGYYTVTVYDTVNGCQSTTDSVQVFQNIIEPGVQIATPDTLKCSVTSVALEASSLTSGVNFLWSTSESTATSNVTAAGTYTVTVTDPANGCSSVADVTVASVTPHTADFPVPIARCLNGNSFSFFGHGTNLINPAYQWNFENAVPPTSMQQNPTDIVFVSAGRHAVTLTITDNGCTAQFTDTVTVFAMPDAAFNADTFSGCGSLAVNFTPTGQQAAGSTWTWDFSDGGNSSQQNPAHTFNPGTYSVSLHVATANGCADSSSQVDVITVTEVPIAEFTPDKLIDTLPDAVFNFTNASQFATTYLWDFGNGESSTAENVVQSFTAEGVYTITLNALNDQGCEDAITKTITIVAPEPTGVHIPTAFSPNGDGKNDFFRLILQNAELERLTIYNRWGELVFHTTNIRDTWDGSYKGVEQAMGVFAYTATVRVANATKTYSGNVTLVR